jgi:ubiquinol-cytochrome c reductase cytochrome c1 subunit
MKTLFRTVTLLSAFLVGGQTFASGGGVALEPAHNDLSNQGSLQNGMKLFVNYCLSCHSAEFMRFNRAGKDLGISDEQLKQNLMFNADKVGETMKVAMTKEDGKKWFGTAVPDLSVVARSRGTDWLYTYMTTFYQDDKKPWGVNNLVFKDVGMPHVMWELEGGIKQAVYKTETGADGKPHQVVDKLVPNCPTLSKEDCQKKSDEYNRNVRDLVNYLDYMGEPAKLVRYSLGVKVILFLLFFTFIAYLLKKEFWRDVH